MATKCLGGTYRTAVRIAVLNSTIPRATVTRRNAKNIFFFMTFCAVCLEDLPSTNVISAVQQEMEMFHFHSSSFPHAAHIAIALSNHHHHHHHHILFAKN